MKLYHRTSAENAAAILTRGFRDGEDVWLGPDPYFWFELGDGLLVVTFDIEPAQLDYWEIVETVKPYREWKIPAAWLNEHATIEPGGDDDDEVLPLPPEKANP